MEKVLILGGGVTGLAAGYVSGLPVFEGAQAPGGICSSYYMKPQSQRRLSHSTSDHEVYRFELGGGHWIYGGDSFIKKFMSRFVHLKTFVRKSSVYFPGSGEYVPYPLQNHLAFLRKSIRKRVLSELSLPRAKFVTMKDWLLSSFGQTLFDLFFGPFHRLYTAGLYEKIQSQDPWKSPVSIEWVKKGASGKTRSVGYNVTFDYPQEGLNVLVQGMAGQCDMRYGYTVTQILPGKKKIRCANGKVLSYDKLICTLPLSKMMAMSGLRVRDKPDPFTSVLVLNIGAAERGPLCPDDHWVYVPYSQSGFHRVGVYSNVDSSFLPKTHRRKMSKVSLYVEKSYVGGTPMPDREALRKYSLEVVKELESWGYIKGCEVVDPTWIEVAYTWSWPGSKWVEQAIQKLEAHHIYPVGRYARWVFQGIADSIRDGFIAGACFKAR